MKYITYTCPVCYKEKTVYAAKYKGRTPKYCSYSCRGKVKWKGVFGEKHPAWRGGRNIDHEGYVRIRIKGKTVKEHRWVMEMHLHSTIPDGYVVHHKNRNRSDNRLENLELIPPGKHISQHRKGMTLSRDVKGKFI